MQKLVLSAALVGGLFLTPSAVVAQNVASLPDAKSAYYLVFLNKDGLSPTAKQTVRSAAGAVRSGHTVRLSGQARYVEAVKKELLLDGVPPPSIVVRHDSGLALPATGDGLSEPQQRRVEIQF